MRKFLIVGLLGVVSLFAAPKAEATDVNLTMTQIGLNNALGGVYIGPYTVQLGADVTNTFQVICDDFMSDTYVGESWTAAVSTFSDLSESSIPTTAPKFDGTAGSIQKYDEVAWLATQLLNPSNAVCAGGANCLGDIQFALWQVFSGTAFGSLTSPVDVSGAQAWLAAAIAAVTDKNFNASQYSNVVILTPEKCAGCAQPQEFVAVRSVPEPGFVVLLGTGLVGFYLYRRRQAPLNQTAI